MDRDADVALADVTQFLQALLQQTTILMIASLPCATPL